MSFYELNAELLTVRRVSKGEELMRIRAENERRCKTTNRGKPSPYYRAILKIGEKHGA